VRAPRRLRVSAYRRPRPLSRTDPVKGVEPTPIVAQVMRFECLPLGSLGSRWMDCDEAAVDLDLVRGLVGAGIGFHNSAFVVVRYAATTATRLPRSFSMK